MKKNVEVILTSRLKHEEENKILMANYYFFKKPKKRNILFWFLGNKIEQHLTTEYLMN